MPFACEGWDLDKVVSFYILHYAPDTHLKALYKSNLLHKDPEGNLQEATLRVVETTLDSIVEDEDDICPSKGRAFISGGGFGMGDVIPIPGHNQSKGNHVSDECQGVFAKLVCLQVKQMVEEKWCKNLQRIRSMGKEPRIRVRYMLETMLDAGVGDSQVVCDTQLHAHPSYFEFGRGDADKGLDFVKILAIDASEFAGAANPVDQLTQAIADRVMTRAYAVRKREKSKRGLARANEVNEANGYSAQQEQLDRGRARAHEVNEANGYSYQSEGQRAHVAYVAEIMLKGVNENDIVFNVQNAKYDVPRHQLNERSVSFFTAAKARYNSAAKRTKRNELLQFINEELASGATFWEIELVPKEGDTRKKVPAEDCRLIRHPLSKRKVLDKTIKAIEAMCNFEGCLNAHPNYCTRHKEHAP